ncbi:hypothetical protein ACLB1E_19280 [Escherichia coli]
MLEISRDVRHCSAQGLHLALGEVLEHLCRRYSPMVVARMTLYRCLSGYS